MSIDSGPENSQGRLEQLRTDLDAGLLRDVAPMAERLASPSTPVADRRYLQSGVLGNLRTIAVQAFATVEAQDAYMYHVLTGLPLPEEVYSHLKPSVAIHTETAPRS
jgi:hypothetical protein